MPQRNQDGAPMKFYTFYQNNSGGRFVIDETVGPYVIIEAPSAVDANEKAQAIGVYFNGCDAGIDCGCCGDRWSGAYEPGHSEPEVYGNKISEMHNGSRVVHIYYQDGRHEICKLRVYW